jgi:YHS domain-containing protein
VPLATVCSQLTGLPTLFVRKQAKEYGTRRLAEGGTVAGRRLAVIEDVITSGRQAIESCRQLRAEGATIAVVLGVIDREAGGVKSLGGADLRPRAIFTHSELHQEATRADIFSSIKVDYKLATNVIGGLIFAAFFLLTRRRGATDPVCGMKVVRAKAIHIDFADETYYFCSQHCLHAFETNPAGHLEHAPSASKTNVAATHAH